jgi:transcriptional regulator with XRE-family HTH domain
VRFDLSDLRAIREQRGLSQQELAAKIGVGLRTIGRWENRKAKPFPLQMAALEQWAAAGTNGKRKAR